MNHHGVDALCRLHFGCRSCNDNCASLPRSILLHPRQCCVFVFSSFLFSFRIHHRSISVNESREFSDIIDRWKLPAWSRDPMSQEQASSVARGHGKKIVMLPRLCNRPACHVAVDGIIWKHDLPLNFVQKWRNVPNDFIVVAPKNKRINNKSAELSHFDDNCNEPRSKGILFEIYLARK